MPADGNLAAASPRAFAALGEVRHLATIGNYPPRRCGIATYTADVRSAPDRRRGPTCSATWSPCATPSTPPSTPPR